MHKSKGKRQIKNENKHKPKFNALVTGHGRSSSYCYRFKLIDNAACPCNKEDQTVDPLIHNVQRSGNWPATKQEQITKHLKSFLTFTKSINFDEL